MNLRIALQLSLWFLPWPLRRRLLVKTFGWAIHPTANISRFALIDSVDVVLDRDSSVGALTVIKGLDLLKLGSQASVGRLNWITGYPSMLTGSFTHVSNRRPELIVGDHSAITNRHLIDCTDKVEVGSYSTIAGFRSQLLTHSIDLVANRQSCSPIFIGDSCFVGTGCILLGGVEIASRTIIAAGSVVSRSLPDEFSLYGGVPARRIKSVDTELAYFRRKSGRVA